jgi:Arf-GAP/coiled-coil/ANK repeat/PH domain-containing protein
MEQMNDVVLSAMEKTIEEVREEPLREAHKMVIASRDEYDSLHRKAKVKDESTEIKRAKLVQDIEEAKKKFEKSNYDYLNRLRDIQTISRFDFTQRLCAFMFANFSTFSQASSLINTFKTELVEVMTAMEHAKKDYMQNKDREDHRISLYVEAKQESGLSKQGYLYKLRSKLGWQLMYVVLKDGQLTWFKKWKTSKQKDSFDLMLSTIKAVTDTDKPFCFEIIHPDKKMTFRALNEVDYRDWKDLIQNAIAHAVSKGPDPNNNRDQTSPRSRLKNKPLVKTASSESIPQKKGSPPVSTRGATFEPDMSYYAPAETQLLIDLRKQHESNWMCADCNVREPEWLSLNTGAIICIECSGIHRSLGAHISKVRSLTMDNIKGDILQFLYAVNNSLVNSIYEANLGETKKIAPEAELATRKEFIRNKYKDKKFVVPFDHAAHDIQRDFVDALKDVNYKQILLMLAQGVDLKWQTKSDHQKGYGHYLVEINSPVLISLLMLYGLPLNLKDEKGQTVFHYSAMFGCHECLEALLSFKPIDEFAITDNAGTTPFSMAKQLSAAEDCEEKHKLTTKVFQDFVVNVLERELNNSAESRSLGSPVGEKKPSKSRSFTVASRFKTVRPAAMDLFKFGKKKKKSQDDSDLTASTSTDKQKSSENLMGGNSFTNTSTSNASSSYLTSKDSFKLPEYKSNSTQQMNSTTSVGNAPLSPRAAGKILETDYQSREVPSYLTLRSRPRANTNAAPRPTMLDDSLTSSIETSTDSVTPSNSNSNLASGNSNGNLYKFTEPPTPPPRSPVKRTALPQLPARKFSNATLPPNSFVPYNVPKIDLNKFDENRSSDENSSSDAPTPPPKTTKPKLTKTNSAESITNNNSKSNGTATNVPLSNPGTPARPKRPAK